MPRPVPVPIRTMIWRRWRLGHTAARIAAELSMAPRTVRHLVHQFRRRGEAALRPNYHRPAATEGAADVADVARETALALRRQHPRWGAPLIRSLLLRDGDARA